MSVSYLGASESTLNLVDNKNVSQFLDLQKKLILVIKKPYLGQKGLCFQEVRITILPHKLREFEGWCSKVEKLSLQNFSKAIFYNHLDAKLAEYTIDFSPYFTYPRNFFGIENKNSIPDNFDEIFSKFKTFWVQSIESLVGQACSVEKASEILRQNLDLLMNPPRKALKKNL